MEVMPVTLSTFLAFSPLWSFQGCSSPLVVKFADTPKDKETKKIQQQFTGHNNNGLMQQMTPGNSMVLFRGDYVARDLFFCFLAEPSADEFLQLHAWNR